MPITVRGRLSNVYGRNIRAIVNKAPRVTLTVEEKVMEFLEAIAEGMPTRGAAAIAQIPFETVRNWISKNDPAFRRISSGPLRRPGRRITASRSTSSTKAGTGGPQPFG
jgi:hypothetical protein